jgi:1-acyl-sn-glycerol-3-phosphate acyltransferase
MQALRSLAYALIFYPATVVFVIAGIVATLFGNPTTRWLVRTWTGFNKGLARIVLGIRPKVEGQIPPGAMLIAVKHESMYETLEMVRLANTPVIVLKRELSQIPFFGWLTRRYGVIPVDRQAGSKALRSLIAAGKSAIAQGRAVLIYPEGTRVPPGEAPELQSGFAGLYRALGLPVVPVAVDSGRLWPKGLLKQPGVIRFKVGEVIPPGLARQEIESRVHAAINALNSTAASPQASPRKQRSPSRSQRSPRR